MKNKTIIGLAAQQNQTQIAGWIVNELGLHAYNLQQPILDATSAILGLEPSRTTQLPEHTYLPELDAALGNLKAMIQDAIEHTHQRALINLLNSRLECARHRKARFLNSGTLIYGINNAAQAQQIRDMGGTMVHVLTKPAPPNPHPDDIIFSRWDNSPMQYHYISTVLRAYQNQSAA